MKNIELFIAILLLAIAGVTIMVIKTALVSQIIMLGSIVLIIACIVSHLVNRK